MEAFGAFLFYGVTAPVKAAFFVLGMRFGVESRGFRDIVALRVEGLGYCGFKGLGIRILWVRGLIHRGCKLSRRESPKVRKRGTGIPHLQQSQTFSAITIAARSASNDSFSNQAPPPTKSAHPRTP